MEKPALNKSDYKLLGLFFSVSTTFILLDLLSGDNSLLEILVGIPMYLITTIGLIGIFIYWLIPRYLFQNVNYLKLAMFGLLSMIILGSMEYTSWFWSESRPWEEFPSLFELIIEGMKMTTSNTGLPLGLLLIKKFYENQLQVSELQQKQKENELKLLRSQISPHFLFNNLNTLDALIDMDTQKAKSYLGHLSALYRYLLSTQDKEVVPLDDEIKLAEDYFYLIVTRFGESYQFDIMLNASTANKYIPTGAIQTVLENVVKHNKVIDNIPIKTSLIVEENEVLIRNNLSEASQNTPSFGIGLENLNERCLLLLHKKINVSRTNTHYEIKIPIAMLIDS